MSVVVIGLNHRTAPLDLLERMTVADVDVPKALHELASRPGLAEVVMLSTCNRLEVYASAERTQVACDDVCGALSRLSFVPPEDFGGHLYVHHEDDAFRHLFRVASGVDSAVIGEAEVLGQVRRAWELARQEDASGASLNLLFRHAVKVGKRARTETAIGRSAASVSSAAVAMARARLGSLDERHVLVLGAGDVAEGMVRALVGAGVASVRIANRTADRAAELAERVGGEPIRLADLGGALAEVDLLLTGTGATSVILDHADLARAVASREDGRELLVVDVAVPRDVEPSAADLAGVMLLDMDDLRRFAENGLAERRGELAAVEAIIEAEVARLRVEASARRVAPLVAELRDAVEAIRRHELERSSSKLADLDERQMEAVEALTKRIASRVLHDPTMKLKEAAGTARGEWLADSVSELFDL